MRSGVLPRDKWEGREARLLEAGAPSMGHGWRTNNGRKDPRLDIEWLRLAGTNRKAQEKSLLLILPRDSATEADSPWLFPGRLPSCLNGRCQNGLMRRHRHVDHTGSGGSFVLVAMSEDETPVRTEAEKSTSRWETAILQPRGDRTGQLRSGFPHGSAEGIPLDLRALPWTPSRHATTWVSR